MQPGALSGILGGIGQGMMDPEFRYSYSAGKHAAEDSAKRHYQPQYDQHLQDYYTIMGQSARNRGGSVANSFNNQSNNSQPNNSQEAQ